MIFTEQNENNEIILKEDYSDRYTKVEIRRDIDHYKVIINGECIANVDNKREADEEVEEYKRTHNLESVNYHFDNNINDNDVLAFSGNTGGSYTHDALYESYIQAKVESEDRLAYALKESMVISEADYSNIRALHEASLGDKVKARWKKFVAFIKGLIARFMESMSNILLNEKEYLEKYKDIILNRKGKKSVEYSYTGNYEEGINRLINTEVEVFDYNKYKDALDDEDDAALVKAITNNKVDYTDGESLADQFKNYFLDLDDGQKTGNLEDGSIKLVNLYNFCYHFEKIKKIVDTDSARLDSSTRNIETMITQKIKNNTTNTITKQQTNPEQNSGEQKSGSENSTENKGSNNVVSDNSSAIVGSGSIIKENENNNEPKNSGLKVTTAAVDKMTSTSKRDTDQEKNVADANADEAIKNNTEADQITKAANKWIRVNQALISAKLTACQQIANDYMTIIRAHVRSYGGTDKKSKEGKTAPTKADTKTYAKESEKAKAEADNAAKAAKQGT